MKSSKYIWQILTLECIPSIDNKQNVVKSATWSLSSNDEFKETTVGTTELDVQDLTTFVPYESLTEETLVEWIQNTLGDDVEQLYAGIDQRVYERLNPVTVRPPLPWIADAPIVSSPLTEEDIAAAVAETQRVATL